MKTLRAFLLGAALALGVASQAHAQPNPALPNFADLVEKHGPAVVNINTRGAGRSAARSRACRKTTRSTSSSAASCRRTSATRRAAATTRTSKARARAARCAPSAWAPGFVISADGYIVTNAHVIENAEEIIVRFTDKRELKAKVIGADKRTDVAVIKVEATDLPVAEARRLRRDARGRMGARHRLALRLRQHGDRGHRLGQEPRTCPPIHRERRRARSSRPTSR